ncbi:MAG TPA: PhzF family phenazine biosynthesis protein [Bacteroidales bacterium]|nr:PhzF family phenazine biosynthesis protein [Bacteroidales bacterium]
MKNQIIYQVDAFTDTPFKGNPAGVCIMDKEPESSWMQNIAMEMNLSETAFVFPGKEGRNIRFFTPEAEMKLCGHATLSASHILYETGLAREDDILELHAPVGKLTVKKDGEWIKMNFPSYPIEKMDIPPEFRKLTGADAAELYRAGFGWTMALLRTEKEVRELSPDFTALKKSEFGDLIVTAPSSDPAFDFCVRCFAPAVGINEDPVTGSAHCALTPYWHARTGKSQFVSHQVSRREGILRVSMDNERVNVSGKAVTVFRIEMKF